MDKLRHAAITITVLVVLSGCTLTGRGTGGPVATSGAGHDVDNVAIVVIDEFDLQSQTAHLGTDTENCAYTGLPANEVGSGGAPGSMPAGFTHGAAVFDVLARELDSLADSRTPAPRTRQQIGADFPWVPRDPMSWTHRGKELVLVSVDTDEYRTADVLARLLQVINSMRARGFHRFVLNMSFVVVPCNVIPWLISAGDADLAAYQALLDRPEFGTFRTVLAELEAQGLPPADIAARLLSDPRVQSLARWLYTAAFYGIFADRDPGVLYNGPPSPEGGALRQVYDDGPWRGFLSAVATSGARVIPVAAAGNGIAALDTGGALVGRQLDFPFAPALWPEVTSASAAASADPGARAGYSNSGEVMLDGQSLTPPGVRGTSFAAPRLSARQALYLLAGGTTTCQGHRPPLGYAEVSGPRAEWLNLTLRQAVDDYCREWTTSAAVT